MYWLVESKDQWEQLCNSGFKKAFVEIIPGQDGLLHISELAWERVEKVEDVLKEGELVKFKVTGKDPKTGKLKLSKKVLMPKPERSES